MKADATTEAAGMNVFNNVWKAYEKRDGASLLSLCAPDPDVMLYGTGADEKRIGLKEFKVQFERDWSQSEAASLKFGGHTVSAAGQVAWIAADGAVHAKVDGLGTGPQHSSRSLMWLALDTIPMNSIC